MQRLQNQPLWLLLVRLHQPFKEWQVASNGGMAIVTSFSSLCAILFDRVYPLSEHKSLHPWTDLRTPVSLRKEVICRQKGDLLIRSQTVPVFQSSCNASGIGRSFLWGTPAHARYGMTPCIHLWSIYQFLCKTGSMYKKRSCVVTLLMSFVRDPHCCGIRARTFSSFR